MEEILLNPPDPNPQNYGYHKQFNLIDFLDVQERPGNFIKPESFDQSCYDPGQAIIAIFQIITGHPVIFTGACEVLHNFTKIAVMKSGPDRQ
jgi:hypothetical protein